MIQSAYLEYEGRVYVARSDLANVWHRTPAVELIQGIYREFPDRARAMLRNRITLDYEPTEMCREMIRVAAKRWRKNDASTGCAASEAITLAGEHATEITTFHSPGFYGKDTDWLDVACALASGVPVEKERHRSPRKIAALLVSPEGSLLGAAVNSNARDKSLHAEVNLVQSYVSRTGLKIPRGATVFVSLKPCRMCAAMIVHCSENPAAIKVIYRNDDPGPHARATALERYPGVLERRP